MNKEDIAFYVMFLEEENQKVYTDWEELKEDIKNYFKVDVSVEDLRSFNNE